MKLLESIDVRSLTARDVPQMASLMNSHYARQRSEAYFHWQYFASAYPTTVTGAFDGPQLIGMFGLQKRRTVGGAMAGQLIDMIVASPWRGRGIFKRLGETAFGMHVDLDFICVLPNKAGKEAVEKTFAFATLGAIPVWRQIRTEHPSPVRQETSETQAGVLEAFEYDPSVLQWRFNEHPEFSYTRISAGGDFVMIKIFTDKSSAKSYGDIVFHSSSSGDFVDDAPLFRKASKLLFSKDVDAVTTWALPHEDQAATLRSLGYAEESQDRYFCLKVLNQRFGHLNDLSRWHLSQSDAEHY